MSAPLPAGLHRRLTNPTFYLKWARIAVRPLRSVARRNVPPPATDFATPRRVEVYLAHPDDETFCGGLLCELVARGAKVHLHCLTRGEGGRTGGYCRAELGRAREAEMRAAASALGVAAVDFLGFADPIPQRFRIFAPKVAPGELAALIARRLSSVAPDWVLTHGSSGEYWHPAHILLHRAVQAAWAGEIRRGRQLALATFNAWHAGADLPRLLNRDDPPTLRLDVSAHAGPRLRAMTAHRSQATLLEGWAGSCERYVELTNPEHYRIRTR